MTISITNSSRFVALAIGVGLVLAVAFGGYAAPAHAALSAAQVQSILSLLQSFGADAATIANVNASLTGGTPVTGGGSSGCSITRDLTVGATGADVTCLQQALISMGISIPAGATGYFGAQTQAAVSQWQSKNGVAPAAGYFGPISRAAWTTVSPAPGPGTPVPPTGLQGSAGTLTVSDTSTDVETTVRTGTTEKVLGFKGEASGSDVLVTNVRVKFTYTGGATPSDRLINYASDISIWANGQKVGSMDASSFTRESSGVYSASIPVSAIVRMGSGNKVTFHVGLMAVSNLDSDDISGTWTVDVLQTRYTDATGAVLFDSTSGHTKTGIKVERLSSSSEVKLRMGEGSNNPKAGNVEVSESNTSEITLAEFTLKAEGANMTFDRLIATTTITGTTNVSDVASDFYLMRGTTKLAEVAGGATASQTMTFSLDEIFNMLDFHRLGFTLECLPRTL